MLRADELAGQSIKKLGMKPQHFAKMFGRLFPEGGATHPNGPERLAAVYRGYYSTTA